MVSFLLDNSLGAWWAARRLSEDDLKNAATEEELRAKARLPGMPLEYLRFVKTDEGPWAPAAGTFDAWPEQLKDFKALDPCCGSGHFLVALLQMLVPLRMETEGLSERGAVDRVIAENIYGLEIDQRCVELAAFALALAAWRYPGAGGYRTLPELHLACSGLAVTGTRDEWKSLAQGNTNLELALGSLHDLFTDAPVLGSLLDPGKAEFAPLTGTDNLSSMLALALDGEGDAVERAENAITAQGLAKAASLLATSYSLVITNVPYLARGKQNERLQTFCANHYPEAQGDLATVFLERCLQFCGPGGTASLVLPQNWLFLTTYRKFREKLLKTETWHLIARLGSGAFDSISGEVVKAILISLSHSTPQSMQDGLFGSNEQGNSIRGVDVSESRPASEKARALLTAEVKSVEQKKQLENPDAIVSLDTIAQQELLSKYADYAHGMAPGDTLAFTRFYWEMTVSQDKWEYFASSPNYNNFSSGKSLKILKPDIIVKSGCKGFRYDGRNAWTKKGIVVGKMRELPASYYNGEIFDDNIHAVIPKEERYLVAIRSFIESDSYSRQVRILNQKLAITSSSVVKVPFDLDYWTRVANEKYPNGLPKPYSDDPTQWIFHGHPCASVVWDENTKTTSAGQVRIDATVLQIAVARLLGYRWPAELDADMELADEQRALVNSCEALLQFADDDGIVCIPAVRGELCAADRLLDLLVAAYGNNWKSDTLSSLLAACDHSGKTLDSWLREKFFAQHCKLFQHRPFIWQIWDGLKDGFSALVNYHSFDYKKLETLIYTYLGDWIIRQKQDLADKVDGAQEKLDAAERLKKKLELILEGQTPYDIFVRWKPLAEQSIGWNPDLNDGVRLNIRPFITAEVLRFNKKPQINVSWDKDRGKDVESAPWYTVFGGERINDHHLTLEEKRKAREGKK